MTPKRAVIQNLFASGWLAATLQLLYACNPGAFDPLASEASGLVGAPSKDAGTQPQNTAGAGAAKPSEEGPTGGHGNPAGTEGASAGVTAGASGQTAGASGGGGTAGPTAGTAGTASGMEEPAGGMAMAEVDGGQPADDQAGAPMMTTPVPACAEGEQVCDPASDPPSTHEEACGPCDSGLRTVTVRCADNGCGFEEERASCEGVSVECDPDTEAQTSRDEGCGPCGSGRRTITQTCSEVTCSWVESSTGCQDITAACDPAVDQPAAVGSEPCGPCNKGSRAIIRSCSASCEWQDQPQACDEGDLCLPLDLGGDGYRCRGTGVWEWCYDSDLSNSALACTWTNALETCPQSSCPRCY